MKTQCLQQYCFNLLGGQFLVFVVLLKRNMKNQNQYNKTKDDIDGLIMCEHQIQTPKICY